MKTINLEKTVFELTEEYPEIIDIMAGLGFSEMKKKAMRHSVGKLTTIPKGAKMKKIPLEDIVEKLEENGFEVVGKAKTDSKSGPEPENTNAGSDGSEKTGDPQKTEAPRSPEDRSRLLKNYLSRLSEGEDLESVRADFKENFSDVDPAEIMKAEQDMMNEGTPLSDVQKLCDLHSALFHGATRLEKIMNAEKAVNESLDAKKDENGTDEKQPETVSEGSDKSKAESLKKTPGHPLWTFDRENRAIEKIIAETKDADITKLAGLLPKIRQLSIHYAKKGDLLYPLLRVNYDITGPSEVMWTVDDEIRGELSDLEKEIEEKGAENLDAEWEERARKVLTRADEMIYKEDNILFPICAENFKDGEWKQIYDDSKDYDVCLDVENETWAEAEGNGSKHGSNYQDGTDDASPSATGSSPAAPGLGIDLSKAEINMPGGHMNLEQLIAVLNTIPLEISFVDENDINCFFNEGPKAFKRPKAAIGRKVFTCHPPKIEPMVRSIIGDFREGKRDVVPVWMEKNGHTMLVRYMAVRDKNGRYLGTMEVVEDMESVKDHFENQ